MVAMDDVMEVVIIGAGIVGLGTAVALHKIGISSVVMEKSESLRNVTGTAIGIRQNGWRALEQLGVADTLRRTAVPIPIERTVVLKEGGRQEESPVIGEFRYLRRKDILDTLYDALPPETVKFGYQLESIKLDSNTNKPVLRFVNGKTIIAKVVIGCEGGKSIVAEFLNLKPTRTFPLFGTRGLTHYPNGHPFNPEFARFRNDNTLVGRIPLDDNLVYWFFVEPTTSKGKKSWEDPEVIRRSTLRLLRDYPQDIQDMIENADTKSLIFLNLRYHSPWDLFTGNFYKGTVAVAGDAMHVMGPFLAQGASTGLEDSIVLARNMAQLGLNAEGKITDQGVEEAFKMFVKERRMRVVKLSVQAYLIGILVGATSPIKKLIFLVLLIFLYGNTNGIDYDCGSL